MLNIDIGSQAQTLFIPAAIHTTGDVSMTLRNTTDGTEVAVSVSGLTWKGYGWQLSAAIPSGLYPGEWLYSLWVGAYESAGLAMVIDGDDDEPVKEYSTPTTCKQYGE